jgi:hypothetical protein
LSYGGTLTKKKLEILQKSQGYDLTFLKKKTFGASLINYDSTVKLQYFYYIQNYIINFIKISKSGSLISPSFEQISCNVGSGSSVTQTSGCST